VELELDGQGRPRAIQGEQGRAHTSTDEHGRAQASTGEHGQVVETIGESWRVDDEWWRQPINRRYFDVVLEGGKHVVLFEDLMTGQWWMQRP
jgi:hypothetical protein